MANYYAMTTEELEEKYDSLTMELMECEDDQEQEIERIADELNAIQDILDERYELEEDEDDDEWEDE